MQILDENYLGNRIYLGDPIKAQGYGDNFAWTQARVTAPASISAYQDHNGGGQYVSASSWQDCPTGPPTFSVATKNNNNNFGAIKMSTLTAAYLRPRDNKPENQKELKAYIKSHDLMPTWFRETDEHRSMRPADRPALGRAVEHCQTKSVPLSVSCLTQLATTKHEALAFLKSAGIEFNVIESPSINKNNVAMALDIAMDDVKAVASRSKAAIDKIQAQFAGGKAHVSKAGNMVSKLGSPDPSLANKRKSEIVLARTMNYFKTLSDFKEQGLSYQQIADTLNSHGVASPTSTKTNPRLWYASGVRNYYLRGKNAKKELNPVSAKTQ